MDLKEIKLDLLPSMAEKWVGRPVMKDEKQVGKVIGARVEGNKIIGKIRLDDSSELESVLMQMG
jgi:hypothetical protein